MFGGMFVDSGEYVGIDGVSAQCPKGCFCNEL